MLRKLLKFGILSGAAIYVAAMLMLYASTPLHSQSINVGAGGLVLPGPYVFGTSGGAAPLPSCTAGVVGISDAMALISNETTPLPSPTAGGQGYVTPVATASTGQENVIVHCHSVTARWGIIP